MTNRTKNIIYPVFLLTAMFFVWKYRQSNVVKPVGISGKTMGTTYSIQYFEPDNKNYQSGVDSLLEVFNSSLNHYLPDSELSKFNRDSVIAFQLPFFPKVLNGSKKVYEITSGAFDPTVMPFVNAWGFGPEKDIKPDSAMIDSLRQFVGFDKVNMDNEYLWKNDPRVTLDFSAVAKGYGIDEVATYLKSKDIENMFVEIGGEVICYGKNLTSGKPWTVGILDPESDIMNKKMKVAVTLEDRAMATSANNFNYRIVDGVKYSHTISPYTGYPIKHAILSASVFADDCMTADAMATAFMVMGHEEAIKVLEKTPEIDAYLVFSTPEGNVSTYTTSGIGSNIKNLN